MPSGVTDHTSLNWDDLRIFLQVARHGGLSQAARRLNLDHSTVSRRIAHLELVIGAKLFDRTRSGLALHAAGRQLLEHAQFMESRALAAVSVLSAPNEPQGTVRIATMEGIGSLYLASRLHALHASYPLIKPELVTSAHPFDLSRREADLFLSFFKPEGRGLSVKKLGEFELSLYASAAYLKLYGVPTTQDDLRNHLFVDYIDDLIAIDAVRWLSDMIDNPRVVFRSNSMIAQQYAAIGGLGLVLLPSFAGSGERRLRIVPIRQISVGRNLWLSVHRDLQDLPRVRVVAQFLSDLVVADQGFLIGRRKMPSPCGRLREERSLIDNDKI